MLTTAILALTLVAQKGPIELNDDNWIQVRDQIRLGTKALSFREVRWVTSIALGPEEGTKTAAPMVIWTANGHPLNLTSTYGVRSRLNLWADAPLRAQVLQFAPVAEDWQRLYSSRSWIPKGSLDSMKSLGMEGIFVISPGGKVLGFSASTNPAEVSRVLGDAMAKWLQLPAGERTWGQARIAAEKLNPKPVAQTTRINGSPRNPRTPSVEAKPTQDTAIAIEVKGAPLPATAGATTVNPGGQIQAQPPGQPRVSPILPVVFRVVAKDLPRTSTNPWADAFNLNLISMDFRQSTFLPAVFKPHEVAEWPTEMVNGLAAGVFIDCVRGLPLSFEYGEVQNSKLTTEVKNITGQIATLRIVGNLNAAKSGYWAVKPGEQPDMNEQQVRGIDLQVLGMAKYDTKARKFLTFDLVAIGRRWGGTPLNGRWDDLKPQPIGFNMTLASDAWYDQIESTRLKF
ncbi:MAG: hypothetical protein K8R88_08875 [Armatimonadetes bacterium]|nr:hypothetical protein [Armatimonadota bacterium]